MLYEVITIFKYCDPMNCPIFWKITVLHNNPKVKFDQLFNGYFTRIAAHKFLVVVFKGILCQCFNCPWFIVFVITSYSIHYTKLYDFRQYVIKENPTVLRVGRSISWQMLIMLIQGASFHRNSSAGVSTVLREFKGLCHFLIKVLLLNAIVSS